MKFYVRVTPHAHEDGVEAEKDETQLRVWVTEPPIQGRANVAVLKVVGKHLGVAPSRLRIISGHTARSKVIGLDE